jgi:imidazole glycerol phosphate synthase subunit HisF
MNKLSCSIRVDPLLFIGEKRMALMASITHFGNYTIKQMKEYLRDRGIPMNL